MNKKSEDGSWSNLDPIKILQSSGSMSEYKNIMNALNALVCIDLMVILLDPIRTK